MMATLYPAILCRALTNDHQFDKVGVRPNSSKLILIPCALSSEENCIIRNESNP